MTPAEMRAAYEAASQGETPPTTALMNGRVLNELLGTDEYDPVEAYWVTEQGITRCEDR